jgi:hypothetical protein
MDAHYHTTRVSVRLYLVDKGAPDSGNHLKYVWMRSSIERWINTEDS